MRALKPFLLLALIVAVGSVFTVLADDSAQPAAEEDAKATPARKAAPEPVREVEGVESPAEAKEITARKAEIAPVLELAAVAVCKDVEDRQPVGGGTSFTTDVGMLFCFTDVRNARTPTQIFHRWYVGDTLVNEIPITVKGPRWRCWSQKTIWPGWSGDCRVEIVTEEGDVIGTSAFALDGGTKAPAPEPKAGTASSG
jgi:hypothetical protein